MINGRILHEDEDIRYGLPYISTCISILKKSALYTCILCCFILAVINQSVLNKYKISTKTSSFLNIMK